MNQVLSSKESEKLEDLVSGYTSLSSLSVPKKVIKRNDEIVSFDLSKITIAVLNAFKATGRADHILAFKISEKVTEALAIKFHDRSIPAVEEIQDIVEQVLMEKGYKEVAKAYILYREQRARVREGKQLLLDIEKTMDGYLKQSDWRVNENSNVNYSLGGLILHNSGAITANYWLNHIYPKDVAQAHKNGDYHLHDLSMFSGYCAGWSLKQVLTEGIGGIKDKINSRPAKHLSTAVSHMVNFLGTMQNEWAGAQAFSSFDTYLAPFVVTDKLTYKEVKQCIQSFVYCMNTPSRWGSQSPFTNITLDWTVPHDLKNQKAIVGGKELELTYGECQEAMDIINRAFIEIMMEGDSDGRGFSYPIPTYNITRDFNWDSENAKLLFSMTAKYGTPYFQNFINSDLDPSDVRSMCCRLQLDKRELRKRGGGLFGADEFTGSIGVVTINLPRLGFVCKSREEFFTSLNDLMEKAKVSLEIKRKVVNQLLEQGLFPYTKRYLKSLRNHFSTIGINGMHECCLNFTGVGINEARGKEFAIEVLDFMRKRLADYQEETGNLYNLEATPAEGTSYRLAKIDKEKFPGIIQSGGEETYYTNSTQLPVGHTENIFQALDHQDELQTKYTGGTVFHGFLGEEITDIEVCKNLVKKVAENYRLPYFTITPTFSICEEHGRFSGECFTCPTCGKECEVYSRVTGYYRPVQNWNKGKRAEYKERKEYDLQNNNAVKSTNINSYKLFYSDTCTKCPPVKNYLNATSFVGEFINVGSDQGLKMAENFGIRSLPSVLFFDENQELISMQNSLEGVKVCVSHPLETSL